MAKKITLNSLGIKKLDIEPIELEIEEGKVIEVTPFLTTRDKVAIINDTMAISNIGGIYHPVILEAVFHALLIEKVTNIGYSKYQEENIIDTYDLLLAEGVINAVCSELGDVYNDAVEDLLEVIDRTNNNKKTFGEEVIAIVEKLKETIAELQTVNPENLSFLKDVVDTMNSNKPQKQ